MRYLELPPYTAAREAATVRHLETGDDPVMILDRMKAAERAVFMRKFDEEFDVDAMFAEALVARRTKR